MPKPNKPRRRNLKSPVGESIAADEKIFGRLQIRGWHSRLKRPKKLEAILGGSVYILVSWLLGGDGFLWKLFFGWLL